jgi:type VI secretion system secreted protein VgrG
MAEPLSQNNRSGKLTTPFGEDVLVLARLHAREGLSELFEFHVEALSEQPNLDFNSALGLASTVELMTPEGNLRYFSGWMTEAHWAGGAQDVYRYELTLRPWFWFLTRTSDCRIFSNMNALQIIKQVFSDRGFSDYSDKTTTTPPTQEYVVQYRETDFNFLSRLMEEFGIYYYFEHSEGSHTLVLANGKSSHSPAPGLASVEFNPVARGGRREVQQLQLWSRGRRAQTGKFTLNEYDYRKPSKLLLAPEPDPGSYAHGSMEMYDYADDYVDQSQGSDGAKFRVQAAQSLDDRRTANGIAPSLFAGSLTTLQKLAEGSENQEYLVTHASHVINSQAYRSGDDGDAEEQVYSGQYEFTPSSRPFNAPFVTPKPTIPGPQSALVVGQSGEEIDLDELGRIEVQFYWDRKSKPSRRIRVAQIWAGSNRGSLYIPRIGDEVMVAYEDGDPDRPICIGSVYNGANTVPANLPSKKTQSGVLTQSSKGGGGYNMLLFDDKKGSEFVKLRSQKDLKFKALNDETRDIGHDQTENIGHDETINVGAQIEKVPSSGMGGGNWTLNAAQTATINIGPPQMPMPMTQIKMDQQSITLNVGLDGMASQIVMNMEGITLSVGPGGLLAQIVMDATGVTISGTPISQLMVQPEGISTLTPMITFTAMAEVTFVTPMVTIPIVTIGAGTASGLPII